MPASPQDLFAFLDQNGIAHTTVWHEAVFTVGESASLKAGIPGAHTKNLFLKDSEGSLVLIAAEAHSVLRLNQLHRHIATRRLSFAPAALMEDVLGVTPGSVTAFSLLNDQPAQVRFLLDSQLAGAGHVNFHPLTNTGTTTISQSGLRRFVAATGHVVEEFDFSRL